MFPSPTSTYFVDQNDFVLGCACFLKNYIMVNISCYPYYSSLSMKASCYSRKTKRLSFLDCNCWNKFSKFSILFFNWYHIVVWHEEWVSIRISLGWSMCFLIILSSWASSLSLVISLFPKWDYRTRWSPQFFFFKLLILTPWYLRALGKADISRYLLYFLGLWVGTMTHKSL